MPQLTTRHNHQKPPVTLGARYGFKEPRGRVVDRPDDPLYHAFGEWLKGTPESIDFLINERKPENCYSKALELIGRIVGLKERTTEDIQVVLLQYQDDPKIRYGGLFLSAYYNLIDQKDLVWDLDIDERIDWIGYRLDRGKRLALKADSGDWIGHQSNGLLANYADVKGRMAPYAKAPAVNFGNVGLHMAWRAEGAVVNFGSVEGSMAWSAKDPSVNFRTVTENMASEAKGSVVNCGSVGEHMARDAENIQAKIAIRNPDGEFYRNGKICLDEEQTKKHPRLIAYFEEFKRQGEAYRNTGFPECLGVFDVVERFVGSGTGNELNRQFMGKLRRLLD